MTNPTAFSSVPQPSGATGVLVLADGSVFWGRGLGAASQAVGEVVFNTGLTGYQETLSDPSYAGQIITFTFPHIGNVGTNLDDLESVKPAARGCVLRAEISSPSSWRSVASLNAWMRSHHLVGLAGVDTRNLASLIRDRGAPHGVIAHAPDGCFDLESLKAEAAAWPGILGMDLAKEVSCRQSYEWTQTRWIAGESGVQEAPEHHVVAIDYGVKTNILRCLASAGCRVTVVPARMSAQDILRLEPDGIFLSNGPGDPAATGMYAIPIIRELLASGKPVFGICLGHQLLALALGARTYKMKRGHRGANQPVKDLKTGKVEITSQNHGFAVDRDSLPDGVVETHVSLFDGSVEGLAVEGRPVFSVQYHPEASPGPQDSHYLFSRFMDFIKAAKKEAGGL